MPPGLAVAYGLGPWGDGTVGLPARHGRGWLRDTGDSSSRDSDCAKESSSLAPGWSTGCVWAGPDPGEWARPGQGPGWPPPSHLFSGCFVTGAEAPGTCEGHSQGWDNETLMRN